MKHLILLKDKSVLVKTNIQKALKNRYKEIKYILFNLNDTNLTFLLHKMCEYMKDFKKATIIAEMVIIRNSMDLENPEYSILKSLHLNITELDELISYLHSINKIRYTNKLANSNETSDFDIICFTHFSIEIFNSKSRVYHNKLTGVLQPSEILKSIKKIYNPIELDDIYISIGNSKWMFTKSKSDNTALYGIFYPYTKSYEFFHNDIFEKLSIVKSVYSASFVYDKKNIDLSEVAIDDLFQFNFVSGSLRFHDIWYSEMTYYLEYISYLSTIQTNLIVSSELAEFDDINDKMIMNTQMQIEVITENRGLNVIKHNIISPNVINIPQFIELLETGG